MALIPDEEKKLREQIRKELEERERRMIESREKEESERHENLENRFRQQIIEEEEARFFSERGYVKYVNRHGGTEWLTPEEAERRHNRRRSKKPSRQRTKKRKNLFVQWAVNGGMVLFAAMVFLALLKFNPIKRSVPPGAILVSSDVAGAMIYINGTEKQGFFTPDTLNDIPRGGYFVAVYKDGYTAWPPMQRVIVEANKVALAEFTLKSAGLLGKVAIEANLQDFRIYVDGIETPAPGSGILDVPAGYHVISVVKPGYLAVPRHQRVFVQENGAVRLYFEFQSSANIGYLQINSNRSGGYVFLNNYLTGMKPNNRPFPVEEGLYEIRICENGFQSLPEVELLRVVPGDTHSLSFQVLPETARDTLQILTPAPGAGIILDGRWMPYVTPLTDLVISEGHHFLNLAREGQFYADQEVPLNLNRLSDKKIVLNF